MGVKLIVMGGLALTFGATSYYAGNQYLDSHTQAQRSAWESNQTSAPSVELAEIVVAAENLPFGAKLEAKHLKMVPFPRDAKPEGSFSSIEEMLENGDRRVINAIQAGEPLLASKVTGKDGRGGLAGVIADGMRAVTIPVNNVDGVAGFVQPGDRVDIVFTHEDRNDLTSSTIVMSNVKVLSVDQDAVERKKAAQVAKSVTLEADTKGAQKLALARSIGKLSLILRSAGDTTNTVGSSISMGELSGERPRNEDEQAPEGNLNGLLSLFQEDPNKQKMINVRVTKFDQTEEVTVPQEKIEKPVEAGASN